MAERLLKKSKIGERRAGKAARSRFSSQMVFDATNIDELQQHVSVI